MADDHCLIQEAQLLQRNSAAAAHVEEFPTQRHELRCSTFCPAHAWGIGGLRSDRNFSAPVAASGVPLASEVGPEGKQAWAQLGVGGDTGPQMVANLNLQNFEKKKLFCLWIFRLGNTTRR